MSEPASIRVRACGILVVNEKLLLVRIKAPTRKQPFWMPPGGAVHPGETVHEAVKREMQEETGLEVETGDVLFVSEFIKSPWHAFEVYIRCKHISGELKLGSDPEYSDSLQMLKDVRFMGEEELSGEDLQPPFFKDHLPEVLSDSISDLTFHSNLQ